MYYLIDNVALGPTGFSATDPTRLNASGAAVLNGVYDPQMGYLKSNRGKSRTATLANNALKQYFTHMIISNDVPLAHQIDVAFSYGRELIPDTNPDRVGIYLWTARLHAAATAMGVFDANYGGTAAAHEIMHIMVKPVLPPKSGTTPG